MKFVSLFASALAVTALVSGCGIVKKSGVTASDSNSTVKTTPVISNISSYDEAQIAPLLGSWAVTAINGQKVVINGDNHPQITFEAIPDAKTAIMVIAFNGCNYLNASWIVQRGCHVKSHKRCEILQCCRCKHGCPEFIDRQYSHDSSQT